MRHKYVIHTDIGPYHLILEDIRFLVLVPFVFGTVDEIQGYRWGIVYIDTSNELQQIYSFQTYDKAKYELNKLIEAKSYLSDIPLPQIFKNRFEDLE